jgi:nicotinamidase/pyrazinamidase
MPNAVLVSDMLRGFFEAGCPLYCGGRTRRIIPNIQRLLEKELACGSKIFFVCDHHSADDPEFSMFPPHCIAGSFESEVIPELSRFKAEIIPKTTFSAFFNTALEEKLRRFKPEKLIVCGVCTNICVLYAVADARVRGFEVEVPVDCVASFDEKGHRYALEHMEKVLGAKLVTGAGENLQSLKFLPSLDVISGDTGLSAEDSTPSYRIFSREPGAGGRLRRGQLYQRRPAYRLYRRPSRGERQNGGKAGTAAGYYT